MVLSVLRSARILSRAGFGVDEMSTGGFGDSLKRELSLRMLL